MHRLDIVPHKLSTWWCTGPKALRVEPVTAAGPCLGERAPGADGVRDIDVVDIGQPRGTGEVACLARLPRRCPAPRRILAAVAGQPGLPPERPGAESPSQGDDAGQFTQRPVAVDQVHAAGLVAQRP